MNSTFKNFGQKATVALSSNWKWIILCLILLFVVLVRIRLLDFPLERDEGEYAYSGQMILHGIPPYKLEYNMKFPGTYFMYALIMAAFGQTIQGIHLGLLLINICSIFLLFIFVKKIIGSYAAIVSAATFALLSLSPNVLGFAGHATHFVVICVLGGILVLYKAMQENKPILFFWSGLLFCLSGIMKQHGFIFSFFGGTIILFDLIFLNRYKKELLKGLLYYTAGIILPLSLLLILLLSWGVLDKFWIWTFQYASDYGRMYTLKSILSNFKDAYIEVTDSFKLFWILMLFGIPALFIHSGIKSGFNKIFLLLLLIFSFISVCPGFYFREHYFITLLPVAAIFFSIFIDYLYKLADSDSKLNYFKWLSITLTVVTIAWGLIAERDYFFNDDTNTLSRQIYGGSPFPESVVIAEYIKANSNPEDKIAIFGSEPQILFYADRLSATGYIYMYPLMEQHRNSLFMQKEMAREIESNMPRYLIAVKVSLSWMRNDKSFSYIFNWSDSFFKKNRYKVVGIIDIYENSTIYKWNQETKNYHPGSEFYMLVCERKDQ